MYCIKSRRNCMKEIYSFCGCCESAHACRCKRPCKHSSANEIHSNSRRTVNVPLLQLLEARKRREQRTYVVGGATMRRIVVCDASECSYRWDMMRGSCMDYVERDRKSLKGQIERQGVRAGVENLRPPLPQMATSLLASDPNVLRSVQG